MLTNNSCSNCHSIYHTAFNCPGKKKTLLRKEAIKTRKRRLKTSADWFNHNPPNENGEWTCYLQISPECPIVLTKNTIVLEHVESKARRKDLQFNINNILPSCSFCNAIKLSKSIKDLSKDYPHLKKYLVDNL